jgi:hypothetical protein
LSDEFYPLYKERPPRAERKGLLFGITSLSKLSKTKKYGKMCEENEEIRARAKEIGINDIDRRIVYAKSLDLEFSKEDCEALAKEAGLDKKNELSEVDLKKVAGGILTMRTMRADDGSSSQLPC